MELKLATLQPTPLSEYVRFFPGFNPSCFQQDLMESCITDLGVWREVLEFWAGNDYRAQSIKKMIDFYDELAGKKAAKYGIRQVKSHVGKTAYIEPEYRCRNCFDTQLVTVPVPVDQASITGEIAEAPCPKCVGVKI